MSGAGGTEVPRVTAELRSTFELSKSVTITVKMMIIENNDHNKNDDRNKDGHQTHDDIS